MFHYRQISYPEWSGNRGSVKPKKRFNPTIGVQEQGIGEIADIYGVRIKKHDSTNKTEKDIHSKNRYNI